MSAAVGVEWHPTFGAGGYSRKRDGAQWVMWADAENRVVHARSIFKGAKWVAKIPVLGWIWGRIVERNYAHELGHLARADFTSNAEHHDDERWRGGKKHYCGRSYSWRGFLSLKHLDAALLAGARELVKTGSTNIAYEEGSLLWQQAQL